MESFESHGTLPICTGSGETSGETHAGLPQLQVQTKTKEERQAELHQQQQQLQCQTVHRVHTKDVPRVRLGIQWCPTPTRVFP